MGLIARLYTSNQSFEEYINLIKQEYNNNKKYCHLYDKQPIQIAREYSDFQEKYLYQINTILDNFEKYIHSNLQKNYELEYTKRPGPFVIAWGMNKSEVPCIGEIEYNTRGGGFDVNEYKKYYFYDKEYLNFHFIKPNKSNDKLQNYTGIFDKDQNLIQLVCVNYASHVAGIKKLVEQEKEAKLNYDDMEKTISNIYGDGKEIKNRGEKCIQWVDPSGQKIELFQNSYIMKNIFGMEGLLKYIWLVYSSPDYNSSIDEIKNIIN